MKYLPKKYLGTVILRNKHEVYKSEIPKLYIIREIGPRQVYESSVSHDNVLALYEAFKGKVVTVDDVLVEIEKGLVRRLSLRYYGYKRRYEIQDILIVLCALGLANMEKEGRRYVYQIYTTSPSAYNLAQEQRI